MEDEFPAILRQNTRKSDTTDDDEPKDAEKPPFKAGSGLNGLVKVARVEPFAVSLTAFIHRALRSLAAGDGLAAISRFTR